MAEDSNRCPTCNSETKEFWKYCRHCGTKIEAHSQDKLEQLDESVFEEQHVSIHETKSEPEFDRDLYYKVLSSRERRARLSKEKVRLKEDISALLNQLQAKVITREFAAPKISELKVRTSDVNKKLAEFKDLPTELPMEILNDEIESVKATIRKLDNLKSDETISKEAIKTEKLKAKETLELLESQKSTVSGHLRNWSADVKEELAEERKDFDSLNIKFKIQEITEDTFKERKETVVDKIEELDGIEKMIENLIK
ncbi:MAG: hypothetical protein ACW99Q_24980 [Candidatus Kariarchaeaceae archaeon]|jgi:chromosome segregation ATPase